MPFRSPNVHIESVQRGSVVRALCAAGADVNAKGEDGVTASIVAAQNRYSEIVQALLAAQKETFGTPR
jgi:ankyrin repeat protein